jgi:hypothetical protein
MHELFPSMVLEKFQIKFVIYSHTVSILFYCNTSRLLTYYVIYLFIMFCIFPLEFKHNEDREFVYVFNQCNIFLAHKIVSGK